MAASKYVKAADAALYREGQAVMRVSKREVPVDFGVLKNSGTVWPPEKSGRQTVVKLTYGGAAKAYALKQHEDLTLNHPGQGKAKYLEDPVWAAVPGFLQRIADRIREIIGKQESAAGGG